MNNQELDDKERLLGVFGESELNESKLKQISIHRNSIEMIFTKPVDKVIVVKGVKSVKSTMSRVDMEEFNKWKLDRDKQLSLFDDIK